MVYDVLIWGATGFTGALVVEYAAQRYGSDSSVSFALGGRNQAKLAEVKASVGAAYPAVLKWPVLMGDSDRQEDMDAVVSKVRVVAACVGPFAKYGAKLVDACVRLGVDYVDITGEYTFVKTLVDKYHNQAMLKNLLIVPCCGFDCVPSDVAAYLAEKTLEEKLHREVDYIYTSVDKLDGTVSGGTLATIGNEMKSLDVGSLRNYWLLAPGRKPRQATINDGEWMIPYFSSAAGVWTVPFVLSFGNVRTVYRSIYLRGKDYAFSEGLKAQGVFHGLFMFLIIILLPILFKAPIISSIFQRLIPQPGQGGSRKALAKGSYSFRAVAVAKKLPNESTPRKVQVVFDAKGDPGYGSTPKLMIESALTIIHHKKELIEELPGGLTGGVLTPSVALGKRLIDRLQANAEVSIKVITN